MVGVNLYYLRFVSSQLFLNLHRGCHCNVQVRLWHANSSHKFHENDAYRETKNGQWYKNKKQIVFLPPMEWGRVLRSGCVFLKSKSKNKCFLFTLRVESASNVLQGAPTSVEGRSLRRVDWVDWWLIVSRGVLLPLILTILQILSIRSTWTGRGWFTGLGWTWDAFMPNELSYLL